MPHMYTKTIKFLFESFLLEQLINAGEQGITRSRITQLWENICLQNNRKCYLSRSTFGRHIDNLRELGFVIDSDFHTNCYTLVNHSFLRNNPLMAKMVDCLRDFNFVDRYRSLGDAIQPRPSTGGHQHLFAIGMAMESHTKLEVHYQPFNRQTHTAILHPYCLREAYGRWYLLAYKEGNTHDAPMQTFALDRIRRIVATSSTFDLPKDFNPAHHFRDAYGIWVDPGKPAEDVTLLASASVCDYLTTLPLHHSQTYPEQQPDGRFLFRLHLSLTPDFLNELQRWGDSIEVVSPQHLRQEMTRRFQQALRTYKPNSDYDTPAGE